METLQQQPNHNDRLLTAALLILVIYLVSTLFSCTTTRYVPVVEKYTDSIFIADTTKEKEVICYWDTVFHTEREVIRQVDSVQMAKYGITIKGLESAWLIEREKTDKEVSRLRDSLLLATKQLSEAKKSEIVEVPVPVERKLSWWERLKMNVGGVAIVILLSELAALFIFSVYIVRKWKRTIIK